MLKRFTAVILTFLLLCLSGFSAETARTPQTVWTYNIEPLHRAVLADPVQVRQSWDEAHLVSALQGLVNRKAPRLYLYFVKQGGESIDRYWLDLLRQPQGGGSSGWLANTEIIEIGSLDELLEQFRGDYRGAVVYDEHVPATSNLASTIAGVENLLPIRYDTAPDSLYSRLITDPNGPQIPVKRALVKDDGSPLFTGAGKIPRTELDSTGSAKCDAYRWLTEQYIKTGKTSSAELGYYLDAYWLQVPLMVQNQLLTNQDYFIARRAPFIDLSPWADEKPNDEPNQPLGADQAALTELLRAMVTRNRGMTMIHVGGFIPWDTKYTDANNVGGTHGAVDAEWKLAEILSNFNAYLDADALGCGAMANASFYAHFPLKKKYSFRKPTLNDLRKKGLVNAGGTPADKTFVAIYAGDYDSAAWVYQMMPHIWNDPNRGSVPISWAFNPNLADRFAPGLDYFRRTATPNDFFIAGDSGAGYVNPMALVPPRSFSNLPSALDVWAKHCKKYYARWDLSVTGFLIDGFAPATDETVKKAYAQFSPDGIVLHHPGPQGITDGMPWIGMKYDLPNTPDAEAGANIVLGDVRTDAGPQFLVYRTILWTPTQFKALHDRLKSDPTHGDRIEFVDMYTFFLLQKCLEAGE